MNVRLDVWQRLTAALMVPLVLLHIAVIFYATRKGLTAGDILARTRGSITWALLYGTFVAAAAVHAAIGLRTVLDRVVAAQRARRRRLRSRVRSLCCWCWDCGRWPRWCCHDGTAT